MCDSAHPSSGGARRTDAIVESAILLRPGPCGAAKAGWLAARLTLSKKDSFRRPGGAAGNPPKAARPATPFGCRGGALSKRVSMTRSAAALYMRLSRLSSGSLVCSMNLSNEVRCCGMTQKAVPAGRSAWRPQARWAVPGQLHRAACSCCALQDHKCRSQHEAMFQCSKVAVTCALCATSKAEARP